MPTYRLHYFPESGNSYKLALMLTLCGQAFEGVWTDFAGGATRTPEWRRDVNPMGEIPVLEVGGKKLTQTAPILLQLAEQHGQFGGETADEKFELLRWLFWDNHKLTGYMATYRFMRTFSATPDEQVLQFLRRRLDDFFRIMQQHFSKQPFAAGERATVADLSMVGYLLFPVDESGVDFTRSHPAIQA
jgi:glutathione S-transferase